MKRKKIWIPVGLAAAAMVLWAFVHRDATTSLSYRFVSVERGDIESVVTSTGTLQPTETVEVGTQVSGQIAELYADFNDRVKAGQLLARIDPTILAQEVKSAEANVARNAAELEQAERELERARALRASGVLTEAELESAEYKASVARAAYASAEVSLERARRNLAYTEIRAPIDGVVVERSVDVGQTVAASMSAPVLFLIAQDLSAMEILASVDESDIGRIHEGQPARFTVQAYGEATFTGEVEQVRLQSKVQENVVSYSVVVNVDNEDGRLLPGMTATVEFVVARAENVLKVPNTALRFQPTDEMRAALRERRAESMGGAGNDTSSARRAGAVRNATAGGTRNGNGVTRIQLWFIDASGRLDAVPVRTGLSDGQSTEIEGAGIEEGMQVIAAVASGAASTTAAPNPFQNQSQGGRGMGPPPGF